MNRINKAILVILVIFTVSISQASEQKAKNNSANKFWVNIEPGFILAHSEEPSDYVNFDVSLNKMTTKSKLTYTLLFSSISEFNLFGPTPGKHFRSLGFRFGRNSYNKYASINYYMALGYGLGITRGSMISSGGWFSGSRYESIKINGFDFILGSTMTLKPLSFIGLGLNAKLRFNQIIQGFSIGASLQLGQLR